MITEYREFLTPTKVYVPLTDFEYKLANVLVEEGEKVFIGQKIADKFRGKKKVAVVSSVSGTVLGFEEKYDRYGKLVDHVVIENDKQEQLVKVTTYEDEVSPAQIRNRLVEFGIERVSYDGLLTNIEFPNPVKHIFISAVYVNEPFVSTDYEFIEKHAVAIADGIALLGSASYCESMTVIVDKFMTEAALDELGKAIVDQNVSLVTIDTLKNKSWDYKVIQKKLREELHINLLDNGVIFTSVEGAKMIHDAVRLGLPPMQRQITLTGDALQDNVVFTAKVGTPVIDLIEDIGGYATTDVCNVHVGSYLSGVQIPSDDFVVTETVDSIRISVYRDVEEEVCIKCGDCNDACPAGILPQNIMDAELRNVNQRIVDLNTNLCIECGLCTYVCPSKINVLEWVRRAKRRVG